MKTYISFRTGRLLHATCSPPAFFAACSEIYLVHSLPDVIRVVSFFDFFGSYLLSSLFASWQNRAFFDIV